MAVVLPIQKATSNADFGRRVGIHYTYASRLRNGQRVPSSHTINAIRNAFDLDEHMTSEMIQAAASAEGFGEWISEHLFEEMYA
jgi:transcriptional regulator with XRE-family HTH domain